MSNTGAHILMYLFPISSHMIPFLDLTHLLLTWGLTVSVSVTPNNLHLLDPLLSRLGSSSLQRLVLPDPDLSTTPDVLAKMRRVRSSLSCAASVVSVWDSSPLAIISDFFFGWTQSLASELGVRRIVFSASVSFCYCWNISLCREPPRIDDPEDVNCMVSFPRIPNSPKFPSCQIPFILRKCKDGHPEKEFYRSKWFENLETWGVVFNTLYDLESIYIDHMKKEMGHDRLWAIGPVMMPLEDDALDSTNRGGTSSAPFHELMAWLDGREAKSVVYVCFGRQKVLTRKQTTKLAAGLEESRINLVWCVREPKDREVSTDHGVIPEGFEDRVAGKGFLIKGWAPQVAILRHRAVGTFHHWWYYL